MSCWEPEQTHHSETHVPHVLLLLSGLDFKTFGFF